MAGPFDTIIIMVDNLCPLRNKTNVEVGYVCGL
jgi:hypothetical protein